MNDDQPLAAQLDQVKADHRRLDEEIAALIASGAADQLELARLKKRKLHLKDLIQRLADESTPDIIA